MRTDCGFTLTDAEGYEYPCYLPATSWRWYQDVEHEDCLSPACDLHDNEGGRRMHRMTVALERIEQLADTWGQNAANVFDWFQDTTITRRGAAEVASLALRAALRGDDA